MKLYITTNSPYSRLARIVVIEKQLEDRVEVIEAQTRVENSPYYLINPSGRVPYLVDDAGVGMEDSQLICPYLDSLDGKPRLHRSDLDYRRFEATARSMCDGISLWARELRRPVEGRSQILISHESARGQRLADYFETQADSPIMQGPPLMANFAIAATFDLATRYLSLDLTQGRPRLAQFMRQYSSRPSMQATPHPPA